MSYNIAICDDSSTDREYVMDFVKQWAGKSGHAVNLATFPSAENFLFLYEEKSDYDILLLDIEMGAMDGCIRRSPAAAGAVVNGSSAVTAAAV